MGVSISYTTTEPVSPEVRKAIEAEVRRLNTEREWWAENFCFYRDRRQPRHMTGDTKIYLNLGDDVLDDAGDDATAEQDFDDDQFMGLYEARFLVQTLARWSKDHGVAWVVEMVGEEMCRITEGVVEPPNIFGLSDPPEQVQREDQEAAAIHARHRGRHE